MPSTSRLSPVHAEPDAAPAADDALRLHDVHLRFGATAALDSVSIMERGRVVVAGRTDEALAGAAGRLGHATLEELYAATVDDGGAVRLEWLGG